jgi:hypothetical protein
MAHPLVDLRIPTTPRGSINGSSRVLRTAVRSDAGLWTGEPDRPCSLLGTIDPRVGPARSLTTVFATLSGQPSEVRHVPTMYQHYGRSR